MMEDICGFLECPDYTFNPLCNRLVQLARSGVPFAGTAESSRDATLRAAMAVTVAIILGCEIKAALVGQTKCNGEYHYLVVVAPNVGCCDFLACMQSDCDECYAVDEATPDLHGCPDCNVGKIRTGFAIKWVFENAEFIGHVAGRLGAPRSSSTSELLKGLAQPKAYDFEIELPIDIDRIARYW